MSGPGRLTIGGIPVDPLDTELVVARVLERCRGAAPPEAPPLTVFSANVDQIVRSGKDREFGDALARGDLVTPDGMPVVWLSRLLGQDTPERVTGVDLVSAISAACAREGRSVFLFGAAPGVAAKAAAKLQERFPGLRVAGTHSPPMGFDRSREGTAAALAEVRNAAPDVLFIAMGAPRQEKFIVANLPAFGAKAILGIGGALDMISGQVRRAPRVVQKAGAEWLWRLSREPKRLWRRYLVDDVAFVRIAARELRARRGRRGG